MTVRADDPRGTVQSGRRRHPGGKRAVWAVIVVLLAAGGTMAGLRATGESEGSTASEPAAGLADPSPERVGSVDRGTAAVVRAPRPVVRFVVGRGARSAAIVRRSGSSGPKPIVIFFHGWGITGASAYRPWIRHLAATGNTVIVPRYQRNSRSRPDRVRANALAGIRQALKRAPAAPGRVVLAGHSAGGSLAADYAARGAERGLPRGAAVFAVYPGRKIDVAPGAIPEVDPARIPASTRLLVLAGARDAVVGEAPARSLLARASRVPRERRRLVRVTDPAAADHLAPTRGDKSARAAFWRRLDRLIAQTARTNG